jgi:hypothetical protein
MGAKSDGATRFLSEGRAICPSQVCGLEHIQKIDTGRYLTRTLRMIACVSPKPSCW